MSIKGVLWRFALAYVGLIVVAGFTLSYLGFERVSGINIGVLIGCTMWVCTAFGKANGRYFTPSEKTFVVLGLLAIDLALQFVISLAALSSAQSGPNAGALLFALLFVGLMHAVGIYVFVGLAGKSLVKQRLTAGD